MPPEVYRVVLIFNAGLCAANTWRVSQFRDGIEYCVNVGGVEYRGEFPARWKRYDPAQTSTFISPVDSSGNVWLTAPVRLGEGLLLRELQLNRTPENVAMSMQKW
jgi:hypothetical protein